MSKTSVADIQKLLLTWYQKHKRDLPWRKTSDPYAIWVSEIMLQQTRVDTVIDYWHRFLKAFPNVDTLADAKEEEVLNLWQGLGYYRRAKLLHKAAKQVQKDFGSKLPTTKQELLKLSGFGPYTSGAVASIAFGEKVPCVDGNVTRVLSRVQAGDQGVEDFASLLANCDDPSSLNQSLMELGALICSPTSPKCLVCPISKHCQALAHGSIDQFPKKKEKAKVKNIYACALILEEPTSKSFFIKQRKTQGRWPGMWEFPFTESVSSFEESLDEMTKLYPHAKSAKKIGRVTHQLTHQHITVDVYSATLQTQEDIQEPGPSCWVDQWSGRPTSVLCRKITTLAKL